MRMARNRLRFARKRLESHNRHFSRRENEHMTNPTGVVSGKRSSSPRSTARAGSTLRVGSTGARVSNLQTKLRADGFDPGAVDGRYGQRTASAVRNFQSARGLGVDGVAGHRTQTALGLRSDARTPAAAARTPAAAARTPAVAGERPYQQISRFARERGFHVTSTTGGRHDGLGHYQGRAVDVRTRDHSNAQVNQLMREARAAGYTVLDERRRAYGPSHRGPHIHIEQR